MFRPCCCPRFLGLASASFLVVCIPSAHGQNGTASRIPVATGGAPVALVQDGTVRGGEATAKDMRQRLNKPIALEKGIERNTPFKDAIEFLSDRYDFGLIVNEQAFRTARAAMKEERGSVFDDPVVLPKMIGVKISSVLRLLSEQVGGTYLIKSGHVEITTIEHARPSFWTSERRDLPPTVDTDLDKRPLEGALSELADQSGISIVLDSKVGDKGKTSVTATLNNVPVDTAVTILADMADLKMVALDSALYVTTRENAERFTDARDRKREVVPPPALKKDSPTPPATGLFDKKSAGPTSKEKPKGDKP